MKKKQLVSRVREIVTPICNEFGVTLWDVTFEKEGALYLLTVFIDKTEGVGINDCEQVSRRLDPILDEPEFDGLPRYTLSVSSAGITRRLDKDEHLEWALGKSVDVSFYSGARDTLTGELCAYNGDEITIKVQDAEQAIKRSDISLVRIHFDF